MLAAFAAPNNPMHNRSVARRDTDAHADELGGGPRGMGDAGF
jgi:hypothetical protein